MRGVMLAWCVAAVAACVSGPVLGQVSPFEDVEWSEAGLERVMVGGAWWEPVSIDGVSVAALYAFAQSEYGRTHAQKRMDEDFLEVMERLGRGVPEETVRLELRPVGGGDVVTLPDVAMTRENRQRLWAKRVRAAEEAARAAPMREVLKEAAALLAERHSYSVARGLDAEALSGMVDIAEDAGPGETVRALRRMVAASGDGHARVRGKLAEREDAETLREGVLPASLMPLDLVPGGRVVAVEPDGGGLVSTAHPFVDSIDGVEIERWLAVAGEVAPGGSVQSKRYGACREAVRVGWIRQRLGIEASDDALLGLRSKDGAVVVVRLRLTDRVSEDHRKGPSRFGLDRPWLDEERRLAYMPLMRMYAERDLSRLRESQRSFFSGLRAARDADGVLIDMRGNTGGSRHLVHEIAQRVLPVDAEPVVYSAARVLMWPGRDAEGVRRQLEGRHLYLPTDPRWTEAERRAIDRFLEGFRPEVDLPDDRFGPLHVSVLSPGGDHAGKWAGKSVVVLMDERCISASDVFLAAMRELPGVTLVGRPSRGASGMSELIELRNGTVTLQISTMVSFMPDGRVFDWHGVEPDVTTNLMLTEFTRKGPDNARAWAEQVLQDMVDAERP